MFNRRIELKLNSLHGYRGKIPKKCRTDKTQKKMLKIVGTDAGAERKTILSRTQIKKHSARLQA